MRPAFGPTPSSEARQNSLLILGYSDGEVIGPIPLGRQRISKGRSASPSSTKRPTHAPVPPSKEGLGREAKCLGRYSRPEWGPRQDPPYPKNSWPLWGPRRAC